MELEAIIKIGKMVESYYQMSNPTKDPLLAILLEDNGKNEGSIYAINFDLTNCQKHKDTNNKLDYISIDIVGSKTFNKIEKIRYVGAPYGNSGKIFVSVSGKNVGHLLEDTIPKLNEYLKKYGLQKKDSKIAEIANCFFECRYPKEGNEESKKKSRKCKWCLKTGKNNKGDCDVKKLLKYLNDKEAPGKNDIVTVKVDGEYIADTKEYEEFLKHYFVNKPFENEDKKRGKCAICGEESILTTDTTPIRLKYFISDKASFFYGLSEEDAYRYAGVCKKCYRRWIIGDRFIERYLTTNMFHMYVQIIPKFFEDNIVEDDVLDIVNCIKDGYMEKFVTAPNSINTMDNLRYKNANLNNLFNNIAFDIIFTKKDRGSVKIYNVIRDVPPSRITTIKNTLNKINYTSWYYIKSDLKISLGDLAMLLPPKKKQGKGGQNKEQDKYVVSLYSNIISNHVIDNRTLSKRFLKLLAECRIKDGSFKKQEDSSNPKKCKGNPTSLPLRELLFMRFLSDLNLLNIEGGEELNKEEIKELPDDIKDLLVDFLKFDEQRAAMFIMGYSLGVAAYKQYDKIKRRAILDKINFSGMTIERIKRLVGAIEETLYIYGGSGNTYREHEIVFSCAKRLFTKELENWKLTPVDNVLYLLAGYGYNFERFKNLNKNSKGGKKDGDQQEDE